MYENGLTPAITGQPLEIKKKVDNEVYVLVTENPQDTATKPLYVMRKEDVFDNIFQGININEQNFNSPTYNNSYQDIIPSGWYGMPDMSLINCDTPDYWMVEFFVNPDTDDTKGGIQRLTSFDGIQFIRIGDKGAWGKWQLISNEPIGIISPALFKSNVGNTMGWLPMNGLTYTKSQYPRLYEVIKDIYGAADGLSFTLPDLSGKYISVDNNKKGESDNWKMPDISDKIGILAGKGDNKTLFRNNSVRTGELFQVERGDDTLIPYLSDDAIESPMVGDPIVTKGLTNYLKIDLNEKLSNEHVGDKIIPDTFYVSNYYIYAGYPQN